MLLGQAQIVYTCGKTKRPLPNWNFRYETMETTRPSRTRITPHGDA